MVLIGGSRVFPTSLSRTPMLGMSGRGPPPAPPQLRGNCNCRRTPGRGGARQMRGVSFLTICLRCVELQLGTRGGIYEASGQEGMHKPPFARRAGTMGKTISLCPARRIECRATATDKRERSPRRKARSPVESRNPLRPGAGLPQNALTPGLLKDFGGLAQAGNGCAVWGPGAGPTRLVWGRVRRCRYYRPLRITADAFSKGRPPPVRICDMHSGDETPLEIGDAWGNCKHILKCISLTDPFRKRCQCGREITFLEE